jgi:hypothetical protein
MELVGFGEDLFNQLSEVQLSSSVPLQLACTDTASFAHDATGACVQVPKQSTSAVAANAAAASTELYQWGTFFYAERFPTTKQQQGRSSAGRGNTECAGEAELALQSLLKACNNLADD